MGGGVNPFISFNAHFLSVNVFQEEGGCEGCVNCFTIFNPG